MMNRRSHIIVIMSFLFQMTLSAYSLNNANNIASISHSEVIKIYDTICQPIEDTNIDHVIYEYHGLNLKIPLSNYSDVYSNWQQVIEYHNIKLCQTEQLYLTIIPVSKSNETRTACDSYDWHGKPTLRVVTIHTILLQTKVVNVSRFFI